MRGVQAPEAVLSGLYIYPLKSAGGLFLGRAMVGERGIADTFPFLLISEASLADLNGRLELPLPMNRFRPNLVVSGCAPYAEDVRDRIAIGDPVTVLAAHPG